MSITYIARIGAAALLAVGVSSGQSLEEKALESRRMQAAQSELAADPFFADSAALLKRAGRGAAVRSKMGSLGTSGTTKLPPDSLLSSPLPADSIAQFRTDTVWAQDSLGRLVPRRVKVISAKPKRYEQRIFGSLDPATFAGAAGSAGRSYILGAGDEITISLWGDKEKEYSLQLNNEGKVFLEGIGLIQVSGFNLDQAQDALKQRLAKVYSGIGRGTTHVALALGKAGPVRVYLLGEVKAPGGYVFTGNTSVLSALYYGKGPTDIGTVRNIQLTRSGGKFVLDLYRYLLKGESLSPNTLQDGDILYSGRAEALVSIGGDVGRPATYELKKGEGVKELLEFAGGVNPTAAAHRLTLRRFTAGGKPEWFDLAPPLDFLSDKARMELKDGDQIEVRASSEISSNYLSVSGPVKYPGTYEATGVATVAQLVAKAGGAREDAYLGRANVIRMRPDGSSELMAYRLDTLIADSIELRPRDSVILYSTREMFLPDSVQIEGAVFRPGKYEFRTGMTVKDLVLESGGFLPRHEPGKALVFREDRVNRKVDPIPVALVGGLEKVSDGIVLKPNDLVHIPVDPKWYSREVVTLEGQLLHPGKYALLYPGERLASVVDRAGGLREKAYVEGGRFFRIRDSVGRVGVDIAGALRKPNCKLNIPLVNGDSIYIPERLTTVKVIGEVGFETSVLFQDGAAVSYYIERAGGFTRRSEKGRVVVQYANGETSRDGYFNRKPDAGSVIFVPQGPEPKPVDWLGGMNAILGTLGVAAAVILSIQAISSSH